MNIWERHISVYGKKGKLPAVFPIVVYHGKARWRFGNELKYLLEETESLSKFQPNFTYQLYDLSKYSDSQIRGGSELWVLLYLLKNIFSSEIEEKLHRAFEVLNKIANEEVAIRCIELVIQYITMATDKITVDTLKKIIEDTKIIGAKETMPTIAETWEMQGFEKGIIKGKEIGFMEGEHRAKVRAERKAKRKAHKERLKIALNMKNLNLDIEMIFKVTELDKKYLERFFKKIDSK